MAEYFKETLSRAYNLEQDVIIIECLLVVAAGGSEASGGGIWGRAAIG